MWIDIRRTIMSVFMVVAAATAIELPPTFFQEQVAKGYALQTSFRRIAPSLADAIEGRTTDLQRSRMEFMGLPVDRPWAQAFGNSAMGLLQEKSEPGTGVTWLRESSRAAAGDLGIHWVLLLSQMHFGTEATFQAQLDGTESAMLALGWQRLPEASSWLLASAREFLRTKHPENARLALDAAIRLDPISPVPPWSAGVINIRLWELSSAYSDFRESFRRMVAYPSAQQVVAFDLLRYLRYTFALSFLLILVAWLVRYWPWISHQMAERLPHDSPLLLRYIVLATFLLALLVAGLGLLTLSFLAVFLLWKPAKRHERTLLAILLIFLGAQPWLAGLEGSLSRRFDRSGSESIYQRVIEEGYSAELEATLDHAVAIGSSTDAPLLKTAQSILLRKKGMFLDALEAARSGNQAAQGDPRPLITLGNMHFLVGHYDTAQAIYEKALRQDPSNSILAFNIGQAYTYRSRLDSTAITFKAASPVAAYRIEVQAQQNSRHFRALPANRLVLDAELSTLQTWQAIVTEFLSGKIALGPWDLRTGVLDVPPMFLPWVSLALLAWLLARGGLPEKRRVLFGCKTCGRVMCTHCRKGLHCVQCFRKLSGVEDIEIRNELLEKIEKEKAGRMRLLRLGMDMAVPGTGRLMAAPGILALLQIGIFSLALGYALNLPNFLSLYPTSEALSGRPIALMILVVQYVAAGIQLVRGISRSTFATEGK